MMYQRIVGDPMDAMRPLTHAEREWKQRIYERVLTVLDLSLLSSVEEGPARTQIREITQRLMTDESAPLSLAQRQFISRRLVPKKLPLFCHKLTLTAERKTEGQNTWYETQIQPRLLTPAEAAPFREVLHYEQGRFEHDAPADDGFIDV